MVGVVGTRLAACKKGQSLREHNAPKRHGGCMYIHLSPKRQFGNKLRRIGITKKFLNKIHLDTYLHFVTG